MDGESNGTRVLKDVASRLPGTMRVACARCAVLVLVAVVALGMCVRPAVADDSNSFFNVALVIDGSGSLNPDLVGSEATDPEGLRYDAISLFLALLTNEGNNVDAIVFNNTPEFLLNTGLQPVTGRDAKVELSDSIRWAGAVGDTDIGSALLNAVDALVAKSAENGLQSVVILFSDGRTDLGSDQEAYEASIANKEAAIAKAQSAGIPVYTICLQATSVADPAELQAIAERTSGSFVAVNSANDLGEAFETFYSLIFATSSADRVDSVFGESGELGYQFSVPTYGAREVNIIVDNSNTTGVVLQSPTRQLSDDEVAANTITGGTYRVIKLVDPEKGTWNLSLRGNPGGTVTVNVIYNIDTEAAISTETGETEFAEGVGAPITVRLFQDGLTVNDSAVTDDYTATLFLANLTAGTQETAQMVPNADGSFAYTLQASQPASYRVYAELTSGEMTLRTETLELSFSNTAPVATKGDIVEKGVIVTPVSGFSTAFDLSEYFSDAQDGTNLAYAVVSSQLVADTVSLDDGRLTIDTGGSKNGDVVIQATDSQGSSAQMVLRMKVTDTRPFFIVLVAGAVLAALIIGGLIWYKATHVKFRGTVFARNAAEEYARGNARSTRFVRGKVALEKFGIQGDCGFDLKKSAVVATNAHTVEFRSSKPVFLRASSEGKTKVALQNGENVLYADKEHKKGLKIEVKPQDRGSIPRPQPRGARPDAGSRQDPRARGANTRGGAGARGGTSRRP